MFHFINSRVNTHCLAVLLSLVFGGRSFASAFTGLVGGAARQARPSLVGVDELHFESCRDPH